MAQDFVKRAPFTIEQKRLVIALNLASFAAGVIIMSLLWSNRYRKAMA